MTKEKTPHPKRDAICNFVALIIIFFAVGALVSAVSGAVDGDNRATMLINIGGSLLTVLIAVIFVKKTSNTSILKSLGIKQFDIFAFLFSLLGAVALSYVGRHICGFLLADSMTVESSSSNTVTALFVLEVIIVGPIAEEIVFRFGGIETLKRGLPAPVVIGLITALFAVMHLYNIQGFISILTISLVWTVVYYYTGNIIYSIISHILYNALQLVEWEKIVLFGTPVGYSKNGFVMCSIPWFILELLILAAAIVCFIKFFRPKYITARKKNR